MYLRSRNQVERQNPPSWMKLYVSLMSGTLGVTKAYQKGLRWRTARVTDLTASIIEVGCQERPSELALEDTLSKSSRAILGTASKFVDIRLYITR